MDNLQSDILMPLGVGVVLTLVEYFLVQPLKENSSLGLFLSRVLKFAILLVITVLLFLIFLILLQNGEHLSSVPNFIPVVSLPEDGLLTDANYSFAAMIYTFIALELLFSKTQLSTYISSLVPPFMISVWVFAFVQTSWLRVAALVLSIMWVMGGLSRKSLGFYIVAISPPVLIVVFPLLFDIEPVWMILGVVIFWLFLWSFLRNGEADYKRVRVSTTSVGLVLLLLWPVDALLLINTAVFSSMWSWIITALFGFAQMMLLFSQANPE